MKKQVLTIMVLAVIAITTVLAFQSCKKEGVYKPKKKISKIFEEYKSKSQYTYSDGSVETEDYGYDKYLSQNWQWDGDILKSITNYYRDAELNYTINFEYDGKRLKSAQCIEDRYILIANYTYDGKKIAKIEVTYNGRPDETYTFTYDGKKVSTIEWTYYYDDYKSLNKGFLQTTLQFALPQTTIENLAQNIEKRKNNNTKSTETETIKLEWDGNNVVKETWTYGSESGIYTYKYDKNINPYYGSFYSIAEYFGLCFSENNVIEQTYTEFPGNEAPSIRNYTFTYDGKFPTMKTYSGTNSYYFEYFSSKSTYTYTTWYEYE